MALAEVMTALILQGIRIERFDEYDYSPYDCFNNTEKIGEGRFRIKTFGDKIPLVYSISGRKEL